jgi:hypothetical protein
MVAVIRARGPSAPYSIFDHTLLYLVETLHQVDKVTERAAMGLIPLTAHSKLAI